MLKCMKSFVALLQWYDRYELHPKKKLNINCSISCIKKKHRYNIGLFYG
jgi:hypothetical protein